MAVPAHDVRDFEFAQKFGITPLQVSAVFCTHHSLPAAVQCVRVQRSILLLAVQCV
jgi:leucyl-tRNA synthetase